MKRKVQIRLSLLLVTAVAAVSDVMLRELPNRILAELDHPAAHRTTTRLVLADLSAAIVR